MTIYTIRLAADTTKYHGYTGPANYELSTFDTPENLSRVAIYSDIKYAISAVGTLYSGIPLDIFAIKEEPPKYVTKYCVFVRVITERTPGRRIHPYIVTDKRNLTFCTTACGKRPDNTRYFGSFNEAAEWALQEFEYFKVVPAQLPNPEYKELPSNLVSAW